MWKILRTSDFQETCNTESLNPEVVWANEKLMGNQRWILPQICRRYGENIFASLLKERNEKTEVKDNSLTSGE